MIVIGSKRQRIVRKRHGQKLVPVYDELSQPVMKLVASEVVRVTRNPLGGKFGLDKHRRLVVALRDGDLLELRPEGTRQVSRIPIADVYTYVLLREANRKHLEKARTRKAAKSARRERLTIKRMEKRLFVNESASTA